jgi:predicted metal-dependent hydrolase
VQLEFDLRAGCLIPSPSPDILVAGANKVPLHFFRHRRARSYILRLRHDGSVRITIPRGGSRESAREFARRKANWVAQELRKQQAQAIHPRVWVEGTRILFRGEFVTLTVQSHSLGNVVQFVDQIVPLRDATSADLRPLVERHLRKLASAELVLRVGDLAADHGLAVGRVTIRDQRTRWGSCSTGRNLTLNWRLIHTPAFVSDYLILHELMHLREMNHSPRFWKCVEQVCPAYAEAEAWLKKHDRVLR